MTWSSQTAGDLCAARSAIAGPRVPHPTVVLATSILASSLAFVDGSVVNVGLPAIGHSLHGDAEALQWVINAYLLPLSAFILVGGAVGDRFGRRETLVFGVALFAGGSALCAAAPNLAWLLAARALQGTGAAILLPNSLAILGGAFPGNARGRAVGIWSATSAMASAFGPVLGGGLIDTVGWRVIFLLNLPLAAAAIGLAIVFVHEPRGATTKAPLDVLGAFLAVASLLLLTWSLTSGSGQTGWQRPELLALASGFVLLTVFFFVERRQGDAAMMPLTPFESAQFAGLSILTFLVYGALGVMLVLVPYLLIQGEAWSATAAGAALLPFPVILALTSPLLGGLADRIGPRVPLTLGSVVVAIGFLVFLRAEPASPFWSALGPATLVISLGMAGVAAPLTTAVLSSVDARHIGSASGLNSAFARLGGLIATALIGSVFSARGARLFESFHIVAIACAAGALVAGAVAFALLPHKE